MKLSDMNPIGAVSTIDPNGQRFCVSFCLDRPRDSTRALAVINKWQDQGLLSDVGAIDLLMSLDKQFDDYWRDKT